MRLYIWLGEFKWIFVFITRQWSWFKDVAEGHATKGHSKFEQICGPATWPSLFSYNLWEIIFTTQGFNYFLRSEAS